jgi:hypothetical protein
MEVKYNEIWPDRVRFGKYGWIYEAVDQLKPDGSLSISLEHIDLGNFRAHFYRYGSTRGRKYKTHVSAGKLYIKRTVPRKEGE